MFRKCLSGVLVTLMTLVSAGCGERINPVAPQPETVTQVSDSTSTNLPRSPVGPYRLASDPRRAIQLECFYALNQGYGGRSNKMIGGNHVSDWNYLASDPNAHNVIKSRYPYPYGSSYSSFYSDVNSYGVTWVANVGWVGRGGQCKGFVDRILYRSGTYQSGLATYSTYINDWNGPRYYTKPMSQGQVGDVIMTSWVNGHVAIVVEILQRDSYGRPTQVDLIDSNVVGTEIIGRHAISVWGSGVGDLDNYFALKLPYN